MQPSPTDSRPLEALARVLASVDAVRNLPALYALLLTFSGAGLLLGLADAALARNALAAAVAAGGASLTVLFYGSNATGLMLMDDARGLPVRPLSQALRDALACAHRLILVLLAVVALALVGLAALAAALALARAPAVGPALFGLLLPAAVLAVGLAVLAGAGVVAPLAAPAVWRGLAVREVLALLARQVRQRLVFVALLAGAVSGLAALVGAMATFVVMTGGRVVAALAVVVTGVEVPPALLMAGLFGRGLRSLGAAAIPPDASPYVGAALVGGGMVFVVALVLPALVYLRGGCSMLLAIEAREQDAGGDRDALLAPRGDA